MTALISEHDVVAGIDVKYRPFFQLNMATLYKTAQPLIDCLWESIALFAPLVRLDRPAHLLIGTAPFHTTLENGTFTFQPRQGVINVAMETFIFLDIRKMMIYPKEIRMACILEEFVHCYMRVQDEDLASKVVASIYPGVALEDGKYIVAPGR